MQPPPPAAGPPAEEDPSSSGGIPDGTSTPSGSILSGTPSPWISLLLNVRVALAGIVGPLSMTAVLPLIMMMVMQHGAAL